MWQSIGTEPWTLSWVAGWPATSASQMAGWGSPADCILTEEGASFRLWPLPCSLETPSKTASQGDVFSPDPGEFRRARGEMFWGKLVASQGWLPCISLRPKDGTATFLPFFWVRGLPYAAFSLWTNRWFLWVKSSFSVPVFTLFLFYFSLSIFFSPDTQALQCMLVSLQAELDIQRYLMKIESSQRVSTLPFLLVAPCPVAFSLGCVCSSNLCQPVPFPALVSPFWSQTLAAFPNLCVFVLIVRVNIKNEH